MQLTGFSANIRPTGFLQNTRRAGFFPNTQNGITGLTPDGARPVTVEEMRQITIMSGSKGLWLNSEPSKPPFKPGTGSALLRA